MFGTLVSMRRISFLFFAAVVGLLLAAAPGAGAAPTKSVTGTIAFAGNGSGSLTGGGNYEGEVDGKAVRMTCPSGGALDGIVYRFFDLKDGYKKFKVTGPTPVVNQTIPDNPATTPITVNEYDIDIYAFDAKCNRIEAPNGSTATGTGFGAVDNLKISKPARYVAVVYYVGVVPNLEVKVEYSN
jgi:hypothetical protein